MVECFWIHLEGTLSSISPSDQKPMFSDQVMEAAQVFQLNACAVSRVMTQFLERKQTEQGVMK